MRTAVRAFVLMLLTTAVATAQLPPPQQPSMPGMPQRDGAAPKTGTAVLKGRVVSAETGKPLRRAQVRAGGTDPREARSVSTSEDGAWELKELPAGRYTVSVSKGGYVPLSYGQRRPFEQGKPVDLAEGQVVEKLDVALPRGSVITGRLFDEFGEPVSGARVSAMRYRYTGVGRRLVPTTSQGSTDTTDDIGQFRLHGLSPGDYYLSASNSVAFSFDRSDDRMGYAPTFYPGTAVITEAQKVAVAQGQEVQGLTFAMSPTRVASISGTLLSSSGKPVPNGMVMLLTSSATSSSPLSSTAMSKADGTFTISNVTPGDYRLQAQVMDLTAIAMSGSTRDMNLGEIASMAVTVTGPDITGISLMAGPAATARGVIRFPGGPPAGLTPSSMMIMAAPDSPANFSLGGGVRVKEDWTFESPGLTGRRLFRSAMIPGGWTIKSVVLSGDDVTDTGIEFKPGEDVNGIEIELSKSLGTLTGKVQGSKGEAVTDYVAIAFSGDSAKWGFMTRFVRTSRPDQGGQFKLTDLPAGDYLVVALDYLEPGEEQNAELLERLRPIAASVALKDGEQKTLTLKVSGNPGSN